MSKINLIIIMAVLYGCTSGNVDDIKEHANEVWASNGFDVVGYQGYEYTSLGRQGGCVWYTVSKAMTTYEGCISKWLDEYHVYNLKAIDALKGN